MAETNSIRIFSAKKARGAWRGLPFLIEDADLINNKMRQIFGTESDLAAILALANRFYPEGWLSISNGHSATFYALLQGSKGFSAYVPLRLGIDKDKTAEYLLINDIAEEIPSSEDSTSIPNGLKIEIGKNPEYLKYLYVDIQTNSYHVVTPIDKELKTEGLWVPYTEYMDAKRNGDLKALCGSPTALVDAVNNLYPQKDVTWKMRKNTCEIKSQEADQLTQVGNLTWECTGEYAPQKYFIPTFNNVVNQIQDILCDQEISREDIIEELTEGMGKEENYLYLEDGQLILLRVEEDSLDNDIAFYFRYKQKKETDCSFIELQRFSDLPISYQKTYHEKIGK